MNCVQVGNKTINTPTEIANNFNNHFTSIAEKIKVNLVKPKFDYSKDLSNLNEYSFFIKAGDIEKVLCEITKLNKQTNRTI